MNRISQLKLKSLFKEYDYYTSEIEWREEFINESEPGFMKHVTEILESNEELKELYDERFQMNKEKFDYDKITEIKEEIREKNPQLKDLYRKVVKKTHPDKIKDENLNEFYMVATKIYDKDDVLNMYRLCNELGIEYELSETDEEYIREEIEKTKQRIYFIEKSLTYQWAEGDINKKEKVVLDYIRQLLL